MLAFEDPAEHHVIGGNARMIEPHGQIRKFAR